MKLVLNKKIYISSDRLAGRLVKFFRKDVTYDTIKSHKKQGYAVSLEDTLLEKPHGGSKIDPLPQLF